MNTTQARLGSALFDNLTRLREQKGSFNMEDVGALLEQLSKTFYLSESPLELNIKEEIEKLAVFIQQTKDEISQMAATGDNDNNTDGATHQLDAVIKNTEEAGHNIMDAADAIQAAADKVSGEPKEAINTALTKIYEACTFQDLTCQRLGKVIKILDEIDVKINGLLTLFGTMPAAARKSKSTQGDSALLNGPQLPDQAPSQDDIDAMFANYKP